MEFLNIGQTIIEGGSTVALLGVFAVLAIPKLRKRVFGNGNGVQKQLSALKDNHLTHLESKLDEVIKGQIKITVLLEELVRKSDE